MSHKPYAIFQFGPNSTRYEILPPSCPRERQCFTKSSVIKADMGDNESSVLRVTGSSTSTITIEVYHG